MNTFNKSIPTSINLQWRFYRKDHLFQSRHKIVYAFKFLKTKKMTKKMSWKIEKKFIIFLIIIITMTKKTMNKTTCKKIMNKVMNRKTMNKAMNKK
jgi:hypothetical protein